MCESAGNGFVFSQGDESKAPGCGNCWCCSPVVPSSPGKIYNNINHAAIITKF